MTIDDDELLACLAVLERSRALAPDDPRFLQLEQAAAHLRKHAKKRRKVARRREKARHDRELRVAVAENRQAGGTFARERRCYVCKQPYRQVHDFYHLLCPRCGDASMAKRTQPLELKGRRALVTGGRIKIGYQTALALLRAGAEVIVTTRFPKDAASRYAQEEDVAAFRDRLTIVGLDFRRLPDVIAQIEAWRRELTLDILINNAAQTVWHPPSYYDALWQGESLPAALPIAREARRLDGEQVDGRQVDGGQVDSGRVDSRKQDALALLGDVTAIDHARVNSWVLDLEDVPPVEMIECQVVNSIVPFLLCSRLEPAFLRAEAGDRYIVNVAALEGQFTRRHKLSRHPHTNMAKAALNMITKTSAEAYAEKGVYMVSVDPGWMSHEAPPEQRQKAFDHGFRPPLDGVDAAARIVDPIARGRGGAPVYGVLLKDFREVPW